MKRTIHIVFSILLAIVLTACNNEDDKKTFRIQGVWEMQSMTTYDGDVEEYPINGTTWMRIYDDSCIYECQLASAPTGTMITPSEIEGYTFIEKVQNDVLYLQGNNTYPLTITNDSMMVIQEMGRKYAWKLRKDFEEDRCKDIVGIIRHDVEGTGETAHHYVFSKAEKQLEATKHTLIYVILFIVSVFVWFINHFYHMGKEKKRVEQELQRIMQEREALPEPIREALNNVEQDFLQSDFYLSLRKRFANGESLKKKDWEEIDAQLKRAYPGFTNKLMTLHQMSTIEYQVCLLLKLNATPSEIAQALCKETSSISTVRSRLYHKVFGKKGSSKEWDEFIAKL